MKIAFFSDLHGNQYAMEAVLADIDREQVDLTIFAGDAVNPFPGSAQVWRTLRRHQIPLVRGNHEDYMVEFQANGQTSNGRNQVQFLPTYQIARRLPPQLIAEMAALPLRLTIPGPGGDDILVCHGSPFSTHRSFSPSIDAQMADELNQFSERVIVGGHHHIQSQKSWRGKLLLICGSAGLPLNGSPTAQYLLLTHHQGRWQPEHRRLPYDHAAALRELRDGGFLSEGGPIAWLIYDELWTADFRMVPCLQSLKKIKEVPVTLEEWQQFVRWYLESIGRWSHLAPLVGWS